MSQRPAGSGPDAGRLGLHAPECVRMLAQGWSQVAWRAAWQRCGGAKPMRVSLRVRSSTPLCLPSCTCRRGGAGLPAAAGPHAASHICVGRADARGAGRVKATAAVLDDQEWAYVCCGALHADAACSGASANALLHCRGVQQSYASSPAAHCPLSCCTGPDQPAARGQLLGGAGRVQPPGCGVADNGNDGGQHTRSRRSRRSRRGRRTWWAGRRPAAAGRSAAGAAAGGGAGGLGGCCPGSGGSHQPEGWAC